MCILSIGSLAVRIVVELAYQHADIDKKGKVTDQTVVSRAVVTALHLQLIQPSHLPLGTKLLQVGFSAGGCPHAVCLLAEQRSSRAEAQQQSSLLFRGVVYS